MKQRGKLFLDAETRNRLNPWKPFNSKGQFRNWCMIFTLDILEYALSDPYKTLEELITTYPLFRVRLSKVCSMALKVHCEVSVINILMSVPNRVLDPADPIRSTQLLRLICR